MGVLDQTVTLSGRLVTLRPVSREDCPTLFRWRSSIATVHSLNFRRHVVSYEQFVGELERLLVDSIVFLVRKASNGAPIGYALTYQMNPWDGWTSAGMYVEPEYRLRGHGGEAALLCTDFLFHWFPLRKVHAEVYEFADTLLRTLQAMGFEEQGYIPDHYWHDDRLWGLYNMVLTREAWERRREDFAAILGVQHQFDEIMATRPNAGAHSGHSTHGAEIGGGR
jgi:RimJ/RimL family protein N-acetyltransferase